MSATRLAFSRLVAQCLIVRAVAGTDTARVWRPAEFRTEGSPPDTLHLMITLGGD
jgi:hypothetical protein